MTDTVTEHKLHVVRMFWEGFHRDPISLERVRAGELDGLIETFFAPDVVFDLGAVAGWPEAEIYEGYDGLRRFYEDWFGMFEEVSMELERLEAVGDLVLSIATQRGSGVSSRTPVEWRNGYLSTVRGSKIVRAQFFSDPDEAARVARSVAASGDA